MPLKKITFLLLVIISLVSLSFGHKLYGYVEQALNELISISTLNKPLGTEQTDKSTSNDHLLKQLPTVFTQPKLDSHQLESLQINNCPRPPLIAITTERKTFVKPDGIKEFRIQKKYYDLNTNLNKSAKAFLHELNIKLTSAFEHIENQLGITLNQAIKLNLVFQTTKTDYEEFVLALGVAPEGSQGIYIYPNHLSVIEFKNHEQGIKTAIHEAIHAFNMSYWGNALRFFNEGMAEYLEAISTKGSIPSFDFSWLTHLQKPEQISTLLFSEMDWHGDNRHELYQNSKALFYFLISHDEGRVVIRKIMEQEMEDPCTTLPKETIIQMLFELFPNHQQEFDYWFTDGLYNFLNKTQDE